MKQRSLFIIILVICFAGGLFLMGDNFASPAFSQGHAGHTAQPPAAVEKQKAAKPQAPQPAPQEEATEEAPQVEISPEQQQLIGVKTVKVSL
ncbi:MAG: hypothetical protein NT022_10195, partial [Deltaproteobacteria bacterium]|nr:hypothetical protein [Deltaproteobacteria bacterium]